MPGRVRGALPDSSGRRVPLCERRSARPAPDRRGGRAHSAAGATPRTRPTRPEPCPGPSQPSPRTKLAGPRLPSPLTSQPSSRAAAPDGLGLRAGASRSGARATTREPRHRVPGPPPTASSCGTLFEAFRLPSCAPRSGDVLRCRRAPRLDPSRAALPACPSPGRGREVVVLRGLSESVLERRKASGKGEPRLPWGGRGSPGVQSAWPRGPGVRSGLSTSSRRRPLPPSGPSGCWRRRPGRCLRCRRGTGCSPPRSPGPSRRSS